MNGKQAKTLRKIAKDMVSSFEDKLNVRFFVERLEDGTVKETLVPMPAEWASGTFRRVYQDLK